MLENAAESPASGAPQKMGEPSFYTRETGAQCLYQLDRQRKYTPKRQARKPYKAMEGAIHDPRGAPWFPVKLI